MRKTVLIIAVLTLVSSAGVCAAKNDAAPFLGAWALTKDGGGAGWLEVTQQKGYLDGALLWLGGSVLPVASAYVNDGALTVTRTFEEERKDANDTVVRTHTFAEAYTMTIENGKLVGTRFRPRGNGRGGDLDRFTGVPEPPKPPQPDLSTLHFAQPIALLTEDSLAGWKLLEERAKNGWRVEDGVLINDTAQPKKGLHAFYGNLRTEAEFEDFNLKLEVNVPAHGNSGVYLRGIYEVQVEDSYGRPVDPHRMGAIYSRIAPSVSAEKPAGEWQTLDITLVDRHVTVILNGTRIIDNVYLPGCTGGAMSSDVSKPGPIYLQGDHSAIRYRNVVLTPIEN